MPFYKALMRLHLKYYFYLQLPAFKEDKLKQEQVQRMSAARKIESMSYERSLKEFGLCSLAKQRLVDDTVPFFKIQG